MQFWDNIIQAVLLGTDKKQISPAELTADMEPALSVIHGNTAIDKEEKFLQFAALAFNYRQSGVVPLYKELDVEAAPAEDRPYCSSRAHQVLNDILQQDSPGLLALWLQHCARSGQIAHPALLPLLLDKAAQHKAIRPLVAECMGKRGEWLSRFNEGWHFTPGLPDEELWLTGTPEQRKQVLLRVSHTAPEKARAWLQETWSQENAASRAELLKKLPASLFEPDATWLESLLNEKSQKVREEALRLLKQLPASTVIQQYWAVVQPCVTRVMEKKLLGLTSKAMLQIQPPTAPDECIFRTGIQKGSAANQKHMTDEEAILYQLISHIPPHFWESHLQDTPANIFDLFAKDRTAEKFLPAIGMATGRFGNAAWARLFTADEKRYYEEILPLLPVDVLEKYLLKRLDTLPEAVTRFLAEVHQQEWGWDIALALFKYTAGNPYLYTRAFYTRHIQWIPVRIAGELDKHAPQQEHLRGVWTGISDHIRQLLALKDQTIKAFQ